jgi:hypothetical protein
MSPGTSNVVVILASRHVWLFVEEGRLSFEGSYGSGAGVRDLASGRREDEG